MLPLEKLLFYFPGYHGKYGAGKVKRFCQVQPAFNKQENYFSRKIRVMLGIDNMNMEFLQLCFVHIHVSITSSAPEGKANHEWSIHNESAVQQDEKNAQKLRLIAC
jgi:hypothetical protein